MKNAKRMSQSDIRNFIGKMLDAKHIEQFVEYDNKVPKTDGSFIMDEAVLKQFSASITYLGLDYLMNYLNMKTQRAVNWITVIVLILTLVFSIYYNTSINEIKNRLSTLEQKVNKIENIQSHQPGQVLSKAETTKRNYKDVKRDSTKR